MASYACNATTGERLSDYCPLYQGQGFGPRLCLWTCVLCQGQAFQYFYHWNGGFSHSKNGVSILDPEFQLYSNFLNIILT